MQRENGRRFGGIAGQTQGVDVPLDVGIVRNVDVLEGRLFRQFAEVPQLDGTVQTGRRQHRPVATERQTAHCHHVTRQFG